MEQLVALALIAAAVMAALYLIIYVADRRGRQAALIAVPIARSQDAEFAAALAQSVSFYVVKDDQRAKAMVAALAVAIEFGKNDWMGGVGNEKSRRSYGNAQMMLRKAQEKLETNDHIAAQEFARLGQELLKAAYMAHG